MLVQEPNQQSFTTTRNWFIPPGNLGAPFAVAALADTLISTERVTAALGWSPIRQRAVVAPLQAIRAEMVSIQAIAGDERWDDVTLGMPENAHKRPHALVKRIEKSKKKVVYTDFENEMGTEFTIELPDIANGPDMSKFKDKARQFLKTHEDQMALQRLRCGQPLTAADVIELEHVLADAGGSRELFQKAADKNLGLGIFIRSLVGMERDAAS